MNKLIEPKEIKIRDKTFTISKFTATDGREIIAKYVMAALPKIGDYVINEAMMYKMMGYVSVRVGDVDICLTTKELVNNHTTSWDLLRELENAILEYNNFFFILTACQNIYKEIIQKISEWTLKTSTALSDVLSQAEKPPSTN